MAKIFHVQLKSPMASGRDHVNVKADDVEADNKDYILINADRDVVFSAPRENIFYVEYIGETDVSDAGQDTALHDTGAAVNVGESQKPQPSSVQNSGMNE